MTHPRDYPERTPFVRAERLSQAEYDAICAEIDRADHAANRDGLLGRLTGREIVAGFAVAFLIGVMLAVGGVL